MIIEIRLVSLSVQEAIHIVMNKNENSLIWPNDHQVKKLFFLVCHINHNIVIVISGFMTRANTVSITAGKITSWICQKSIWDHNNTKNITIKKSLKDLILLIISNLYVEVAKVIHAIKVPISTLNQRRWNTVHKIKHRQIEKRNKYSCDSAILAVILGIKYLLIKNRPHHKAINFKTNDHIIKPILQLHSIETSQSRIIITKRSCIMSIHIDNLQNVLSFSHLSVNNFITTIVLLNDKPTHK